MSKKEAAMEEIPNTGDIPMCPKDFGVCLPVHGRSGPKVGTYVVVKCMVCKTQFKVGPKK